MAQNETPSVPEEGGTFKVYRPSNRATAIPDLPDSYFTPSAADLRVAQSALFARTQAIVNAPLELRATREAKGNARQDRWPFTTIRVRFTDRTQLEKVFPSTDKIRSVYAFVRSSLREDVKSVKFILYQTPPKRDLKVSDPAVRDLSLWELQLAPSSVLLLRFVDETMNATDYPAPLAPSVLSQAVELPVPPNFDSTESSQPLVSAKSSSSTKASGSGSQIPKWLKIGSKK